MWWRIAVFSWQDLRKESAEKLAYMFDKLAQPFNYAVTKIYVKVSYIKQPCIDYFTERFHTESGLVFA